MLVALLIFLCLALMACSYLYAERKNLLALVVRQDALLVKQDRQLEDWANKALARNSMTPLGEEREEATPSTIKSQSFDLRPPIARAHEEWDEEEEREVGRVLPLPLPGEVRSELLDAAREVTQ